MDTVAAMPLLPAAEFPQRLEGLRLLPDEGDEWLKHAFGLAHAALAATLGFTLHRQQLLAARLLLDDRLVEMATGEGKTAAIALAAGVAALLFERNPDWKPEDVTKRLLERSVRLCDTPLRQLHAEAAVLDQDRRGPRCR